MKTTEAHVGQIVRDQYGQFYRLEEVGVTRSENSYYKQRKDHFIAQPVEQNDREEWETRKDYQGNPMHTRRISARHCISYDAWAEQQRKREEERLKREEIRKRQEIFNADVVKLLSEKLDVVVEPYSDDCPIVVSSWHNTDTDDFTVRRVTLNDEVLEEIMAGASACEHCGKAGRDLGKHGLEQVEIDGVMVLWCQSCRRKHKQEQEA